MNEARPYPPPPRPAADHDPLVGCFDTTCLRCGTRIGWQGRPEDCPDCPRCGQEANQEALAADRAKIEECRRLMQLPGFNSYEPCRSCGAAILFVVTTNNKLMPLDETPSPTGNVVLDPALDRARVLKKSEAWEGNRYVSHFVTCPNWVKSRKGI